jgi:hypothetical protein
MCRTCSQGRGTCEYIPALHYLYYIMYAATHRQGAPESGSLWLRVTRSQAGLQLKSSQSFFSVFFFFS